MEETKTKRQKGSLTIEATVALTTFMFFLLFLYSFTRVYAAQSYVSHNVFQTSQNLALQSFSNEELDNIGNIQSFINNVVGLINAIWPGEPVIDATTFTATGDWYEDGNNWQAQNAVESVLAAFMGGDRAAANRNLEIMRVRNGFSGLDFSETSVQNNTLCVSVTYEVDMWFQTFFGINSYKEFTVKQYVNLWNEGGVSGGALHGDNMYAGNEVDELS